MIPFLFSPVWKVKRLNFPVLHRCLEIYPTSRSPSDCPLKDSHIQTTMASIIQTSRRNR